MTCPIHRVIYQLRKKFPILTEHSTHYLAFSRAPLKPKQVKGRALSLFQLIFLVRLKSCLRPSPFIC